MKSSSLKFIILTNLFISCSSYKESPVILDDTCLLFFESLYTNQKWSCSANLLNQETLITAAHCADSFKDSHFKVDAKNKIYGFCKIKKTITSIQGDRFIPHLKYSFDDITTGEYDLALVKLTKPLDVKKSIFLVKNSTQLKALLTKNQCHLSGYQETTKFNHDMQVFKAPSHYIFLKKIRVSGVRFQKEYAKNKMIIHGGRAEKSLTKNMKESLKLSYPGAGYSGGPLICRENDQFYNIGVYVGGYEDSHSWVSILYQDDILTWLHENFK